MSGRPPIVYKYGGSAMDGPTRLDAVARDVLRAAARRRVAVVVSAMGDATDRLIALVRTVNPDASKAHEDMVVQTGEVQAVGLLAAAIERHGGAIAAFTAQQVGFVGSDTPGSARLLEVRGVHLIRRALAASRIVIVPGFQAVAANGQIVTLGRGGSDLTAVALAVALRAERCVFKKDVDGLSPVDPRLVPDAIVFHELDYDQARDVAQDVVLMDRAICLAQAHAVPLAVARSPSLGPSRGGTIIRNASTHDALEPEPRPITAVRAHEQLALVKLLRVPDRPGQAARLFDAVRTVSISDAIQAEGSGGSAVISFLVREDRLPEALDRLRRIHQRARGDRGYVGLTVFDRRMREDAGFLARTTAALARARVNIALIATSGPAITLGVRAGRFRRAVIALADAFALRRHATRR